MELNVALVGNPNCGKTTLFNALTGANQYVGNWPGVTVEKKTGKLKGHSDVTIVDLPGIYSLSPYTLEEVVARDYLIDGKPDAIINIVDGSNLERNLYLSTQVIELGIPTIMAVNMMDVVEKEGDSIDLQALSEKMGCPVVAISALKNTGITEAVEKVLEVAQAKQAPVRKHQFADEVEQALTKIEDLLPADVSAGAKRFFAVKLFERDSKIESHLSAKPAVEDIIKTLEKSMDDDAESIIVNERYSYITSIIDRCVTCKNTGGMSVSDKIDQVVTNRFLALPIFVVIMFFVYWVSVSALGTNLTDWINDGLFGDGWYIGAGQDEYSEVHDPYEQAQNEIKAFNKAAAEYGLEAPEAPGDDASDADKAAYEDDLDEFIQQARDAGISIDYDAYDKDAGENEVVTVDADEYADAVALEEPDPTEYGFWVPGVSALLGDAMKAGHVDEQVQSLVTDGIIPGVSSVLSFLPQLILLFLFLAFLEGCGYMARVAFILDRVFRRFGLSGKSFIPMLIGTGCGVPGVMASRTIENENDRHMTVMTTTFMPCSAKLPVIALIAGAVFGGVWWVAPSAYFLGIASILVSGIILKKTKPFAGKAAPFVMELPAYHWPTPGSILRSMGERCWSFIRKAGTIILAAAIVIWFLSGYGFTDGAFGPVDDQAMSLLAMFGNAIAWIFTPQGFNDWQAAAATVTGLIAKENVINTFGILYAGGAGWYANVQAAYAPAMGYAFLAFNLLCAPCFAAMGAIRKEMGGGKWFWAAVGYECGFAYVISMLIYQFAGLVLGEVSFNVFTIVAIAVAAAMIYLLVRPNKYESEKVRLSVNEKDAS